GRQVRVLLVELTEQLADVAVDVVVDLADGSLRPFARGARHEWWCASTPSSGSRLPRVVASAGWPAGRPEGPLRCRRSAPHRWAHRRGTTQRAARSARGPRPARPYHRHTSAVGPVHSLRRSRTA